MPNTTTRLTAPELRSLLKTARLVHRQDELDIRFSKRATDSSRLPGRILIITPRKVGTAPQRNLVRRRIKSIFHEEQLFELGFDIVVYCRKGSANLSFSDLKRILLHVFNVIPTSGIKK